MSVVVWSGRGGPDRSAGLDGWNTTTHELTAQLREAEEFVVEDALSAPWRYIRFWSRLAPMTVTLPDELDLDGIVAVLDRPVLRYVTEFDRVIAPTDEVREALTALYSMPSIVWEPPVEAERTARAAGKRRLYEAVAVFRSDVVRTIERGWTRVGFLGRAADIDGPVTAGLRCGSARFELEASDDQPPAPSAVAIWLEDGGQTSRERRALFERARDLLHPGGRLMVLGYVVTAASGAENPRISALVEEINDVFGGCIQFDEVQSVQWQGETMSRSVLLGGSSLVSRGRI